MSKVEEYGFNCMLAMKDDVQMLHIEVRSQKFKNECYFKHYSYDELPQCLRRVFKNLCQIFIFLQRKEMIYFDEEEQSLKICLSIAGEIKQFPIFLQNYCKRQVMKQKIQSYEQEKAKINYDDSMVKIEKNEQLKELNQVLATLDKQRTSQQSSITWANLKIQQLQLQIQDMRRQCQDKMRLIRQLVPKQSQAKLINVNEYKRHQDRKKFWIEEIAKLKKQKFQQLKHYINKNVNFEAQLSLSINYLRLTKMLFVEIFINLEILDLSHNAIVSIEGLRNLKQLLKLKLTQNKITTISPLPKLEKLLQLILDSNSIKKLENIFHLSNLQILNLSQNKIEVIPDDISKLNRLVQFRIYQNQITTVSEKVLLLKNIKVFSIMKNRCYNDGSKAKEIINKMIRNGIKTAIEELPEINILE